jgi:glycosyltransferase involved in cell wall biosynthesis
MQCAQRPCASARGVQPPERPVRVLQLASFYGTSAGGFVPLIGALARALVARGDELALVAPRVPDATWHAAARDAGIELHLVDGGADALRFARAWRPDVAHVHFADWATRATAALWTSRARILWHIHSSVTAHENGRAERTPRTLAKYRLVGSRVERFVAVSAAIREEVVRNGAPRARVALVTNAVDGARFRPPTHVERDAARAALGVGDRPAILFFGRDPRIKGADVLADALSGFERPVVIAVSTPAEARDLLAREADVIAIERTDDVVPLLWAADALAMPSRAEGFGLVLREAVLSGLPAAATDLPALRETAAGDASVHFALPENPRAFGVALRAALAMPHGADEIAPRPDDSLARWANEVLALYAERRP